MKLQIRGEQRWEEDRWESEPGRGWLLFQQGDQGRASVLFYFQDLGDLSIYVEVWGEGNSVEEQMEDKKVVGSWIEKDSGRDRKGQDKKPKWSLRHFLRQKKRW